MLNTENYGKPIEEKLSNLLREFTSKDDIANVSAESKVGFDTIKKLVYRTANVTENNSSALNLLVIEAVNNCSKKIEAATEAKAFFETNIIETSVV